ncbi:MAG: hypothetical protein KF850_14705 [Labilithrix sp.]|nr:hypothetical protein [Labilithrix sp.]
MPMRSAIVVVVVAGAFASVVLACEDDSSGGGAAPAPGGDAGDGALGPGTTPPATAAGDFCDKTVGVVVSALESCCTADDKVTDEYGVSHGLVSAVLPLCRSTLEASIAKARVLYRADAGEACFAAYRSNYAPDQCANIMQTFADPSGSACRAAFAGVGEAGAPCLGDHECVDGLTCVGYTKGADGACKPPPAIGEACGAARVDGGSSGVAVVKFGTHPACVGGARCVDGECAKAAADGESCTFSDDCAAPLECVLGKCGASGPGGAGARCLQSDDCAPDTFCERASGAGEGTCTKRRSAGGSCTGAAFVTECIGRCDAEIGAPGTCVSFCGSP